MNYIEKTIQRDIEQTTQRIERMRNDQDSANIKNKNKIKNILLVWKVLDIPTKR